MKKIIFILYNILVVIKNRNVRIGHNTRVIFRTKFEGKNKIGMNTVFGGEIGRCSYVGANCNIIAKIGRYTSISNNVNFISAIHPTNKFVSTSPVFYSLRKQCVVSYVNNQKFTEFKKLENEKYSFVIGNDVLISHGVTLIGAVNIGDGAIIGANALVTKDVEPYSIVAGVPAKVIGKRFDEELINLLLKFEWWNKDELWIINHADMYDDIENFKKKVLLK
jgi:acetyltransferase-like isoleucine patch superfamily enzyme